MPKKTTGTVGIVGMLDDHAHIIAMGAAKLKTGKWFTTCVSVDLLERALKTIKAMGGIESVNLTFSEKSLLIIGKVNRKKRIASGVIIAPRDEEEEP